MSAYDSFVYSPLKTVLSPVVRQVPRYVRLSNGANLPVFTANIVTLARTFLVVPIAWFLKYIFGKTFIVFISKSIVIFPTTTQIVRGKYLTPSGCATSTFEGVRRVVSIWKFVRLYWPIIGSRNKNLGLGGTSYSTYLEPWVPIFGFISLWRPATFVKMKN